MYSLRRLSVPVVATQSTRSVLQLQSFALGMPGKVMQDHLECHQTFATGKLRAGARPHGAVCWAWDASLSGDAQAAGPAAMQQHAMINILAGDAELNGTPVQRRPRCRLRYRSRERDLRRSTHEHRVRSGTITVGSRRRAK